jgi:hypothetical protein
VELQDAALMMVRESAEQPAVAALAQSVYQTLADGDEVSWQQLDQLVGEASGKGVLRALHARYSPVAYNAILRPILAGLDQRKPVPPRPSAGRQP